MQRRYKPKRKVDSINFYIYLSILIHAFMFLITGFKRDIALGNKVIPIEIIPISSIDSKGEYFQRPEKNLEQDIKKNINKEKEIKKEFQENLIQEDENKSLNVVSKIIKDNIVNPKSYKINKDTGNEGELNTNEIEKGSLKGEGIEEITCLSCIKPKYPYIAIKRGYEGILKLKIWISKNGEVTNVKIIKSSGYKSLDRSGVKAAKKSKFYPLTKKRSLNVEYELRLNR